MGKRFNIKSQVPIVPSVIRASAKLVFGFAELRPVSYIKGEKDGKFFIQYLDRLKKLSGIDWNTANISGRHSFGMEKMPIKSLSSSAKSLVPAGMDSLIVLRATGDNHAFLGYRDGNVFQVIFIEYQFGDIYCHSH